MTNIGISELKISGTYCCTPGRGEWSNSVTYVQKEYDGIVAQFEIGGEYQEPGHTNKKRKMKYLTWSLGNELFNICNDIIDLLMAFRICTYSLLFL